MKFSKGEKVFCYHGQSLYEAKILSNNASSGRHRYLVHYIGWNKNWDELVSEHSLLKYNPKNKKLQQHLSNKYANTEKDDDEQRRGSDSGSAKTKKDATVPSSDADASLLAKDGNPFMRITRSQRNSLPNENVQLKTNEAHGMRHITASDDGSVTESDDGNVSDENKENMECESVPHAIAAGSTEPIADDNISTCSTTGPEEFAYPTIVLPYDLKMCLTVDWKNITRDKKLYRLPAEVTVEDVIHKYLSSNSSKNVIVINEILLGVIEYFNVTIGSQLLYFRERDQYSKILKDYPSIFPSKLYGAFHLLRLFVNLGKMMRFSDLDESTVQNIMGHLNEFLNYLDSNRENIFDETGYYKEPVK